MNHSHVRPISCPASLAPLARSTRAALGRWLSVCAVLACTACAPIPQHIYVPDAADGKVVYSQCPMNKHLPEGIVFTRDGVQTTVRLGRNDGRDYVDVQLEVPEGKTVVLQTHAIELDRRNSQPVQQSVFPNISPVSRAIVNSYSRDPAWQKEMLPVSMPLVGGTTVDRTMVLHKNFWFAAYIDPAAAPDVWITLPALTINGTPVRLEGIHFHRRLMVLIALINC